MFAVDLVVSIQAIAPIQELCWSNLLLFVSMSIVVALGIIQRLSLKAEDRLARNPDYDPAG